MSEDKTGLTKEEQYQYGIELAAKSSSTIKNDLQKYLQAREEIREFYSFAWKKLEEKINELFDQIKDIDQDVYTKLQGRKCYQKLVYVKDTLFPDTPDPLQDPKPKNITELEDWELAIAEDIPLHLKHFFQYVYSAFKPKNSPLTIGEQFWQYHNEFERNNAKKRYPYEKPTREENPHFDQELGAKIGKRYDWTRRKDGGVNLDIGDEFMHFPGGRGGVKTYKPQL